jgi:hypothetical protein
VRQRISPVPVSSEPAILAKIREALEIELLSRDAPRVLFEALARYGTRVPQGEAEVALFASGPLTEAIAARAEPERARRALRRIEELLSVASAPTSTRERLDPTERRPSTPPTDAAATSRVPVFREAVPVLVVSRTSLLASRIRAALGGGRVEASAESTLAGVAAVVERGGSVVIVDAMDPPDETADDVADVLVASDHVATIAVWGVERPYGRRVVERCERAQRTSAGMRASEGFDSILDLISSRIAPG